MKRGEREGKSGFESARRVTFEYIRKKKEEEKEKKNLASSKREAMEHQRHLLAKRAIFARRTFKRTHENRI